jgi:hypothetical protein
VIKFFVRLGIGAFAEWLCWRISTREMRYAVRERQMARRVERTLGEAGLDMAELINATQRLASEVMRRREETE